MTNNLERRIYEHKNKLIDGFTKKYNLNKVVYYEYTNDVEAAIKREKEIKKWRSNCVKVNSQIPFDTNINLCDVISNPPFCGGEKSFTLKD